MAQFLWLWCLLALLLSPAASYSIEIAAGKTECFYLTSYDESSTIYGSFEVISTDPKPIVVVVKGPKMTHFQSEYKDTGESLTEEEQETLDKSLSEGSFSFDSEVEGDFSLCLSNGNVDNNDDLSRIIAFNYRVSSVLKNQDYEYLGIESELSDLKEGLNRLKDHQSYMNQREDVHQVLVLVLYDLLHHLLTHSQVSLDNINTKILCWTVLEVVILISMAFWQITYISGFFERTRKL